jgi:serine/threonine-protein kinase
MTGQDPLTLRAMARVGQVLRDKWRLGELLGVGGMASVYAATHRNGLLGAVKVLHPELALHPGARERFLREGYVANKVGHPGAVRVLDDDAAEDGSVFLVMELLEGETVEQRAASRAGGRLEAGEVMAIGEDLLDVLVAAHRNGIVHRDLKPDNLFLTREGQLKVLDFGIARMREHSAATTRTTTGSAMGTPAFMAPEQASGKWTEVDARTDIWAVGATMYVLLTGQHVHSGETVQLLMLAAMTRPAAPVGSLVPGLERAVAAVVDRALAFDPQARWQSAREMQSAVRAARRGAPADASTGFSDASLAAPPVGPPGSVAPRKVAPVAIIAGLAALAVVAVLVVGHLRSSAADVPGASASVETAVGGPKEADRGPAPPDRAPPSATAPLPAAEPPPAVTPVATPPPSTASSGGAGMKRPAGASPGKATPKTTTTAWTPPAAER